MLLFSLHVDPSLHLPFNSTSSQTKSFFLIFISLSNSIHRTIYPHMHSSRRSRECVNECVDIPTKPPRLDFSRVKLDSKKTWSSGIRTLDLRVSRRLLTPKTTVSWYLPSINPSQLFICKLARSPCSTDCKPDKYVCLSFSVSLSACLALISL